LAKCFIEPVPNPLDWLTGKDQDIDGNEYLEEKMETNAPDNEEQSLSSSADQEIQASNALPDGQELHSGAQPLQDEPLTQEPLPALTRVCPHCQQEHPVGAKFCPDTGKSLMTESQSFDSQPAQVFPQAQQASYPPPQPPSPAANQAPYPPLYQPYIQPRPSKDRNLALVLEILPGLFGILGIGWIYSGKTSTGIAWLVGYLIWVGIAIAAGVISGFMACFCTVPINLICVGISAYSLNNYLKSNPHYFGP
jgi:TM2 domain-containing membrane protein YozV